MRRLLFQSLYFKNASPRARRGGCFREESRYKQQDRDNSVAPPIHSVAVVMSRAVTSNTTAAAINSARIPDRIGDAPLATTAGVFRFQLNHPSANTIATAASLPTRVHP